MLTTLTLATLLSGTIILDDGPHEHSVLTEGTRMLTGIIVDYPNLGRKSFGVGVEEALVDGGLNVSRDPYTIQWDGISVEYQGAGLADSVTFPIWTGSEWFDATASMTLRNNPTVDIAAFASNLVPVMPHSEAMRTPEDVQPVLSGSPVTIDWTLTGPVSTLTGTYSYDFAIHSGLPSGWEYTAPVDEVVDSWWSQRYSFFGPRLPIMFEGTLDGVPIRLTGQGPIYDLNFTPEPSSALLALLAGLAVLKPISARRRLSRPRL